MPIMQEGEKPTASLGFTLLCAKMTPGMFDHYAALLRQEIAEITA